MLRISLILMIALPLPARAVIILDSTWAEYGGQRGAWDQGFDAHFELAAQARFSSIMGLWDGTQYGGSGTWIGNDADGNAYVLTAAHNFDGGGDADTWTYYTRDEMAFDGLKLWIHPEYDENNDETSGYDMAIVMLDGMITDAGPPPYLYSGDAELGEVVTITGYGARGIGSQGEKDRFYTDQIAAAARNVIDEVDGENGTNLLVIDFDSEDGDANALDGDAYPVGPLEGILGSGDSGGASWIKANGGWAIAGVNVWGDDAVYGSVSAMARVSTQGEWITSIFPDARFTD